MTPATTPGARGGRCRARARDQTGQPHHPNASDHPCRDTPGKLISQIVCSVACLMAGRCHAQLRPAVCGFLAGWWAGATAQGLRRVAVSRLDGPAAGAADGNPAAPDEHF